jgi:probable HAF family extracellular repeat protein
VKQILCGMVLLVLTGGSANAANFTPLGDLRFGAVESQALGISADGSVVVGYASGKLGREAFRWTGGVMTSLGDLPDGSFYSHANRISADGSVVVGVGRSASGGEAFRWTGGVMTGLGDLPGGSFYSVAIDVSADGSVVVGSGTGAAGNEAFRWTGGVMTGLGDFAGGSFQSVAVGVSADGSVVVGMGTGAAGQEAFRWTGGVMTGLGDLPGGSFSSKANDVSADGSVVVGYGSIVYPVEDDVPPGDAAFIWTADGGMEQLFDVLVARGATGLTGWTLATANAISADGQWIAGTGYNPLGQTEAFLANIAPVPIPPAVCLFGSALGVMGWMRRKAVA